MDRRSKLAYFNLNNGRKIPSVGLGVWQISDSDVVTAVRQAIHSGYRHIDTAAIYGNEVGVGEGIRQSHLSRSQIFVTTKLSVFDIRKPVTAFSRSLHKLGLEYVDLYLIHWPFFGWKSAWQALEEMYFAGRAKSIGVSNFTVRHLERLSRFSRVTPAVNQVEISPFLQRHKLVEYCRSRGIVVEAYSPLTRAKRLDHPELVKLARSYRKSAAQIIIRWNLQKGVVVLPKSQNPEHISSNIRVFDFHITDQDMEILDSLETNFSLNPLWSRG